MAFRLASHLAFFLIASVVCARAAAPKAERLIRRESLPGAGVPEAVLLETSRLNGSVPSQQNLSHDVAPAKHEHWNENQRQIIQDTVAERATKDGEVKQKRPQDDCYDAVDVAAVSDDLEANREFWKARCHMFGREIASIRVTMGDNVDYFKPKKGNSKTDWCNMIQSNQNHLWSKDAITWHRPVYVSKDDYKGFLGGSDQTWPVGQGLDEREFISFWGGAKVKGGCCSEKNAWNVNQWEEKFVLSTCSKCSTFAVVNPFIRADKKYWKDLCENGHIPASATMLRVSIGFVTDYFRPKEGHSICDMLTSHNLHLWSEDGISFKEPSYGTPDHLGGSSVGWPKNNVVGEQRRTLNIWGSNKEEGGCCSTSLRNECEEGMNITECFYKPVEVEYCRDLSPIHICKPTPEERLKKDAESQQYEIDSTKPT